MQVRRDLASAPVTRVLQGVRRARVDGDPVGSEIRRPHPQAPEELGQRPELTDVLEGHPVTAALPVVLLGVDGHDHQYAGRASAARLGHRRDPLRREFPCMREYFHFQLLVIEGCGQQEITQQETRRGECCAAATPSAW